MTSVTIKTFGDINSSITYQISNLTHNSFDINSTESNRTIEYNFNNSHSFGYLDGSLVYTVEENANYEHNRQIKVIVSNQTTLSGRAIDGYLQGSTVCLDLNRDGECSPDTEPTSLTDNEGLFDLNITQGHRNP